MIQWGTDEDEVICIHTSETEARERAEHGEFILVSRSSPEGAWIEDEHSE